MVRIGGRSKGCATCLKRKIRCDEKVPECLQCVNGRRKCPGAVSGMMFLLGVTKKPNLTARKKGHRPPIQKESHLPVSAPSISGCPGSCLPNSKKGDQVLKTERVFRAAASHMPLRSSGDHRAKQGAVLSKHLNGSFSLQFGSQQQYTQQALSHFIGFFAKGPLAKTGMRSWMYLLPEMLSSERFPAVRISIIAASVIYIGSLSNEKAVVMEGYKWYGSSLERQRRQLQLSSHGNTLPTAEEICMPLMLSFFEVICSTSPTAYFQHIIGAARLLEVRGPEGCKSGIFRQLFLSVRVQMIYTSFSMREASIFGREEWLTIPFLDRPKTVFDKIVDVLIRLSLLLSHLDNGFCSTRPPLGRPVACTLETELNHLKVNLDSLWDDLRTKAFSHGWEGECFEGKSGFDFVYSTSTTYSDTETRDALTSAMIAFYSTARILVLSLLSHQKSELLLHEEQITAHCASILYAAEFLSEYDSGCAYVRLILPLKVVGLSSPDGVHRERARNLLETWRLRSGTRGICEVVLSEMEKELQVGCRLQILSNYLA